MARGDWSHWRVVPRFAVGPFGLFLSLMVVSPRAEATGITLCRNPEGIVLTTDSRVRETFVSYAGGTPRTVLDRIDPKATNKLHRFAANILVAAAGDEYAEWRTARGVYHVYRMDDHLRAAALQLPPKKPVSVETSARAILGWWNDKLVDRASTPRERAVLEQRPGIGLFIVVGTYEGEVDSATVEARYENGRIATGMRRHRYPSSTLMLEAIGVYGEADYRRLNEIADRERPGLQHEAQRSLSALADLCGRYLAIKARTLPFIGPPFHQALVRPSGIEWRTWKP